MEEIFLEAELRKETGKGKVGFLRRKGFIPAVLYGEGKSTKSLKLSTSDLLRFIHQYRVETAVVNIRIKDEDKKKEYPCLIKDIQYDPVKGDILHVDLNQISLTKAIKINVPLVAKGEPVGVKQEGGILNHVLWEMEVECLPINIPKEIEADVNNLKINEVIRIKDLKMPADVKPLTDPDAIVFAVEPPLKEEEVVVPLGEEAKAEPEVIKEKKETPEEKESKESKEPKEKESREKEKENK
jgi:large subunit ribosomal protein L25